MARLGLKALAWAAGIAVVLVAVTAALLYVVIQTQPGHDFVLRTVLNQAPNHVEGEVRVDGVRSEGLLGGFTLHGVAIVDDRGRPFVEADSLRVRYSVRGLLRGEITLVPAEVWRPRVVLETLHGDERINVVRIFRLDEPRDPEGEPGGVSVRLRGTTIHDGSLLVRVPVHAGAGGRAEAVEGAEGLYRVLEFTALDARIRDAELAGPELEGQRVVLDALSLRARVLAEPFEVKDFAGEITHRSGRIDVEARRLHLPETEVEGSVVLYLGGSPDDGGETALEVRAAVRSERLSDLRWLEPRIPEGRGRAEVAVIGPLSRLEWRITEADVESGGSRVWGRIGLDPGDELRFADTDLQLASLHLDLLEPWLDEPLPVEGRLRGRVRAAGPLRALSVDADVTYDDAARGVPPSTGRIAGVLGLGGDVFSVDRLSVQVDPLRYATLRAFAPDLELAGEGTLRLEASGAPRGVVTLTADLTHVPGLEGEASRVTASGTVRATEAGHFLDLTGNLGPLSFGGLEEALGRELPLSGQVSGPVRAVGVLEDLFLDVNLATPAGMLAAAGRLNALDPGARYRAEGRVRDFQLHRVLRGAPEPTVVTGDFAVDGRGLEPSELAGRGRIDFGPVRIAEVELDRVGGALRAEEGRLFLDALEVSSPFVRLEGSGDLALREDAPAGRMAVTWEAESLAELRPLLLGDRVIAADTLTPLDRRALLLDGVDPDTLPDARDVALEGSARGALELRGALHDLEGHGHAEVLDALYGEIRLEEGRLDFGGLWRGREDWEVDGVLRAAGFGFGRHAFDSGLGQFAYRPGGEEGRTGEGDLEIELRRNGDEVYRTAGAFAHDDAGVDLALRSLLLEVDPLTWTLDAPSRLRLVGRTLEVDAFRISGLAAEDRPPFRAELQGVLSLDGEADFRADLQGVDLHQVAEILRLEDVPGGILDLTLDVRGPPDAPIMDGRFVLHELATGETVLSRVEGTLEYSGQVALAHLEADMDGRRLLRAQGRVPVDLSFQRVEERFPDREMAATLAVDSLPAAPVLAFLDGIDDIQGVLDGRIDLRGTPREPLPSGEIHLRGGAASLPELGLRLTGVGGEFRLGEDRVVQVSAVGQARGTARIEGTIALADLSDPRFDLRIVTSNFQAVDRRDLNARLGAEIMLTGRYRQPHVQGLVRVEQGSLFLDEFARTAEVVDLTDRAFWDVVDTTVVTGRQIAAATENPFIRNLRVDVDLAIQRDFWLRSREMNVEMDGELMVTFDRPTRELLLVGSLEAVRGSYTAFGRQFQVQEGSVEFVGTPGINPSLDIRAVNRVRREGGEPLNVFASLVGTLENMRVELSSDAQPPIAQSDLISYLVFGRPSYALASGERSVLEGAAGAGVEVGLGLVATQLGAVVAQQFGVDYFAITQAREGAGMPTEAMVQGTLAQTQIEMGQYVGQNLFLAITLRPLTGLGARTQTQFPGARLEWRFTDLWTTEAFLEDRFAREAAAGFGELGLRLDKVFGFSLYREWGY
jgi:translocation and assembly module TamB